MEEKMGFVFLPASKDF